MMEMPIPELMETIQWAQAVIKKKGFS